MNRSNEERGPAGQMLKHIRKQPSLTWLCWCWDGRLLPCRTPSYAEHLGVELKMQSSNASKHSEEEGLFSNGLGVVGINENGPNRP